MSWLPALQLLLQAVHVLAVRPATVHDASITDSKESLLAVPVVFCNI